MSKCLAVVTENGLEPTAQTNNTLNAIKLAILQKQAQQGFNYNDEIWITESGEIEIPVTGVYEVTLWRGGNGGVVRTNTNGAVGGLGYFPVTFIKYYEKGQVVPVTIGAGGIGLITDGTLDESVVEGGATSFGDLTYAGSINQGGKYLLLRNYASLSAVYGNTSGFSNKEATGGGIGGGSPYQTTTQTMSGTYWGAGGAARWKPNNSHMAGNGFQGAAYLRFFNPEKAVLSTINDTDLIPYLMLLQRLEAIEAQLNINS